MKAVKKISARLQKKLATKTEKAIQSIATESVVAQIATQAKQIEPKKLLFADIVQAAKQNNPEAFDKIEDKKAINIARSVFQELSNQINQTEEGSIVLPNIGRFIIKQWVIEKDGRQSIQRKVFFRSNLKKVAE